MSEPRQTGYLRHGRLPLMQAGLLGRTGRSRAMTAATVAQAVDDLPQRLSAVSAFRWLAPASVAGISAALGVVAAVWFTTGRPSGYAIGAAAGCASYLAGRTARGLAGPQLGAWPRTAAERAIGQVAGVAVEAAIVAALAAGGTAAGQPGLWRLATIVLILLTIRQVASACSDPEPDVPREALLEGFVWRVLAFPPGGQMLLVAVVTPVWGSQAALTGMAWWSAIALASMLMTRGAVPAELRPLPAWRDDGPVATWLGRLVRGQLIPLPPALTGLAGVSVLAVLGLRDLPGFLLLTPVIAMLLASVGASHPHDGRLDWLAPALLLAGQYVYLAAAGFASGVPLALVFLLCALIALHYRALTAGARAGLALGWDGRMLVAGLGAALGLATFAYLLLACYVAVLVARALRTANIPEISGQ
jgi:hypothetical protein